MLDVKCGGCIAMIASTILLILCSAGQADVALRAFLQKRALAAYTDEPTVPNLIWR